MGPRRIHFQLNILFILVSYCWLGRWTMGRADALKLPDKSSGSLDEQIRMRSAARRFRFSDVAVDECTDFFSRVCGRASDSQYSLRNVLDKKSWHDVLINRLEALISADVTPADEPAIQKVKRQYQLCMNYDKRDRDNFDSLRFLIQQDSDFPMIMFCDLWDSKKLRILESQKYDPSLFSIRVRDNKIYIDKYGVSAYGGFLSNLRNVSAISHSIMYKSKIKEVFQHMRLVNQGTEHLFDQDLDAVMNFRRDLHKIARIERLVHTQMTVGDLQRFFLIDLTTWSQLYWESFLQDVFINATGVTINSNTIVYVETTYLIALRGLLMLHGPRCIANHIKLHFFETYIPETSRPLIQISKDLASATHDTIELHFQKQKPISSSNPCIHQPHILRALNYMYLKKWFPKKSRDAALNMVKRIKNSLRDYVRATRMISHDALQRVADRINLVTLSVGSGEEYGDYKLLDPLYRYEVPADHLYSVLNARRYFKEYEYSTLTKSKNTTLLLDILEDKPSVSVEKGIINLPIGYLHRTSLSPTLSEEMSYATLGYKISRFLNEVIIKQGFLSQKFSKDTPWYPGNWTEFSNRTACIENQYELESFNKRLIKDEEFKNNYNEMLERSVYDNAAFQTLYSAFRSALRDDKISNKENSSNKPIEQEFITNWADRYCMHDQEDRKNPTPLRVNNVLRNSNLFHLSFDCDKGTAMNPLEKCLFWA